ncbi:MAG: DUF1656 domain-containing protein [Rhodopila sp.]|nr:DUF1656 domain-containing protein [Rhodopila sp.]
MTFTEVNIFGVYVAPIAPMMLVAWVILLGLRRIGDRAGLLRHVWRPSWFVLAIYVVLLGAIVLLKAAWGFACPI